MLKRILTIKNAVVSVLAVEMPQYNTITSIEWEVIGKCVQILKIFDEVTTAICAEKTISISKTIIFVTAMKEHVEKMMVQLMDASHLGAQEMAITLKERLISRFHFIDQNTLAAQASFLDPRFKKYAFSDDLSYLKTYEDIKHIINSSELSQQQVVIERHLPSQSSTDIESLLYKCFDEKVQSSAQLQSMSTLSTAELEKYIDEKILDRRENPLRWWKERKHLYPILYQLAMKRLCVLATSVPCERLFSKAGQILTERRNRLSTQKFEKILFLNSNLGLE